MLALLTALPIPGVKFIFILRCEMPTNEQMLSNFRACASEINERLNTCIKNHRKTNAVITVIDKNGKPVSEVSVKKA